ncbi:MAG: hypothetical protein K5756_05825 [Clostridiales bacterium]|nr:hypothetical protein [Clostridiales bacterium]
MADIQEFKCPNCSGKLEFDIKTQKMLCPFCSGSFDPKSIGDSGVPAAAEKWDRPENEWRSDEIEKIKTYICKSCGGEIITEATTAATSCPYCGNPVVLSDRVEGLLKPDYVIPFQQTKEDAKNALRDFVQKNRFAPGKFKRENRLEEIKGMYVPFWLFDSNVFASAEFEARRIRRWSEGEYDCAETSYYSVSRAGDMRFENIPVDASKKMSDDLMDSLEPFYFKGAEKFLPSYLAGFLADKYDVSLEDSVPRADERIKNSANQALSGTVSGYDSVSVKHNDVHITSRGSKYALFPVWLLNTKHNGINYRFAMNGQTGKFIGNLPISKGKLAALFGAVAVCVSGALWGLGFLIGLY